MKNLIFAARLIELPHHVEPNGELVVLEGDAVIPFNIARVFLVRSAIGKTRGRHAHRKCSQFLVCSAGRITVTCDDGFEIAAFTLDRPNLGLFIPPSIWAEQSYEETGSILTVLCDHPFEEGDYIRDYEEFKSYKIKMKGQE